MKSSDQKASILGIILGLLLVIASLRMDFGHWNSPGPGFMPVFSGLLLIALCIAYWVQSTWMLRKNSHEHKESPWPRENRGRLIIVIGSLFVFAFLLPFLGYLVSTFLLMFLLFRVIEPEKWYISILKAFLTVFATYLIFDKWLMVQFPESLLGV